MAAATRAMPTIITACCASSWTGSISNEFVASSISYRSGRFDDTLKAVLRHHDAIMEVMLPTLREERRQTYSPVLPISPKTGRVLQVPVELLDPEQGLIAFEDEGEGIEQSALSGGAK